MLLTTPRYACFHEHATHLGAANTFSESTAKLEHRYAGIIPELRDEQALLIGSDYSGFHQDAQFEVTSFLITNFERIGS